LASYTAGYKTKYKIMMEQIFPHASKYRGNTVTAMKLAGCAILYAMCSVVKILKIGMDFNLSWNVIHTSYKV
jgi:hypothetical protein